MAQMGPPQALLGFGMTDDPACGDIRFTERDLSLAAAPGPVQGSSLLCPDPQRKFPKACDTMVYGFSFSERV
jgi:hypothetical protein